MKIINILGLAIVMLISLTACGSKGILVETREEEGTEAVFGEISANASDSDAADTEDVVASEDTITVYVCGAVVQEGVYELPAGSRISDALLMAGGYDENALHGYVNLAERLEDGERIYFPDYQELEELGIVPISSTESSESGLVNINTADAETLKTLPGIGDAKAADIIAYLRVRAIAL